MRRLIPSFILDKHRSGETRGDFDGAALFVDLSGFSQMADELSTHGQYGAEALADVMRIIFEPLVEAVYEQGGFVAGYAGDAFNAIFPAGQARAEAARHCLAAALKMQIKARTLLNPKTPFGEFPISIKIGMGFGETRWQIFKSKDGAHATFWFRGESLTGAVDAEAVAPPGQIALANSVLELLKDDIESRAVGKFHTISKVNADLPAPLLIVPEEPDPASIGIFFPESISQHPVVGEFRQVVNLFVDIPLNISDEALVAPFMETVYALQEKYGGFFLRPDLGDKGFNLLMFWGAPVAHENDVQRALNFVIDLAEQTKLNLRAGVSYRIAYAGFMGSSLREDYTNYGWGANLAARLMEYAGPGAFWMDEETASRAERTFHVDFVGEFKFKGFTQNQKTYALLGRRDLIETVYQGKLLGRSKEMELLGDFVAPLKTGSFAGVMVIKGEAGIGKSRLVHAFQRSDIFNEQPAEWVICQSNEILRQPFHPFRDWLRARFNYEVGEPDSVNWDRFVRALDDLIEKTTDDALSAELSRTSSVLAALLNINAPGTLYEQLDAKGRYENTLIALSALLRADSLQKPLVLFMEDTHWLDADSGAFLTYFVRTLLAEPEKQYPIAIIATQRPEGESVRMMDEVAMYGIKLGRLSSASMAQLAETILGKPVAASVTSLLEERADGNPFFTEQIVRYLQEHNGLTLTANDQYEVASQAQLSLPMDVQAVMIARLDRLPSPVRAAVQTASVIGREFEVRLLGKMIGDESAFPEYVKIAERANVWAQLNDLEFFFRHALLRDAAYSMQLETRRRELHAKAVDAMESLYEKEIDPYYGELAYHAEKAGIRDKALHYLNLAADAASKAYLNTQAIDYYTRILALTESRNARRRFEILYKRAEGYDRLSNRAAQQADLNELEEIAESLNDDSLRARVQMKRAYYYSTIGDSQSTILCSEKAIELARSVNDVETLLEVYVALPTTYLRMGKLDDSLKHAQDALEFSRTIRNRHEECSALTSLGLVALEKFGPSQALVYQKEALDIARELGDKYLETKALNNLGNTVGLAQGDYVSALQYFEQTRTLTQELGDRYGMGIALTNLGWVTGILGDYERAKDFHAQALVASREVGNRIQELYTLLNLSACAIGSKNSGVAIDWSERAWDLSQRLNAATGEAWAFFYMGLGHLLKGQHLRAREVLGESLRIRREINVPVLEIETRAALAQVACDMGELDHAMIETEKVLEYMEQAPGLEGAEEPLRIYYSCCEVLQKKKDPRFQGILQKAKEMLETQVSRLPDGRSRRMYIENVPWRNAIHQMMIS